MSQVKHISFEELAANLATILDAVRDGDTAIVVEYANGKNVQIKPSAPHRRRTHSVHSTHAAVVEDGAREPLGEQLPDTQNISSVGAVYDLDPGSITPG